MYELNFEEVGQVRGGLIPVVAGAAVLGFCEYQMGAFRILQKVAWKDFLMEGVEIMLELALNEIEAVSGGLTPALIYDGGYSLGHVLGWLIKRLLITRRT